MVLTSSTSLDPSIESERWDNDAESHGQYITESDLWKSKEKHKKYEPSRYRLREQPTASEMKYLATQPRKINWSTSVLFGFIGLDQHAYHRTFRFLMGKTKKEQQLVGDNEELLSLIKCSKLHVLMIFIHHTVSSDTSTIVSNLCALTKWETLVDRTT